MTYILDGYNILFRKQYQERSLEELRSDLLHNLNTLASHLKLTMTVVFDAHNTKDALKRQHWNSLEIVFTDPIQTADDFIIEYAASLPLKKRGHITVVSSDGHIRRSVRSENIRVLSVDQFFHELSHKLLTVQRKLHSSFEEKSSVPTLTDTQAWEKLFAAGKNT